MKQDTVDSGSYIFTEEDVYLIGGYLAGCWVKGKISGSEMAESISEAIFKILSLPPDERKNLLNLPV